MSLPGPTATFRRTMATEATGSALDGFTTVQTSGDFPTSGAWAEQGRRHVPLGRIGVSQDAAGLAVLLCSPAARCIMGQTMDVDGGLNVR